MTTRRGLLWLFLAAVVLLAALAGLWALGQSRAHPMTDAATVDATTVNVAAIVPGQVVEVAVENNQHVQEGDILFRVDPEPYRLQLEQAQAQLAAAKSELKQGEGNRTLEASNAEVASSQVSRAQNNFFLARQTLSRLEPLLPKGYVTAQEVDSARTAVHDAQVSLDQAQSSASGTAAFVGSLNTRKAGVDAATAAVGLAERNLKNTEIRASLSGAVTGLKLAKGDYVVTGATLFSLIDTAHWRVSALFRETDLPNIHIGSKVRVFLLSSPDLPIEGVIGSIGWGIHTQDEANLLGLPIVASRLDWVRSAARFPVEITLNNPPKDLTRLGASASARIIGSGP